MIKNFYYVDIGTGYSKHIVNYYPKDKTISAHAKIYSGITIGELIEQFGPDGSLSYDTNPGYYDSWDTDLYIDFKRLATEDELIQILPQIEKEREKQVKQAEKDKKAEEKRKQQTEIKEKKDYLRLKKKYEG